MSAGCPSIELPLWALELSLLSLACRMSMTRVLERMNMLKTKQEPIGPKARSGLASTDSLQTMTIFTRRWANGKMGLDANGVGGF